jgi:hypothetical protein
MAGPSQQFDKATEAARVFTPAAPVSESDLFAGRMAQLRKVIDAIVQRGQHAIYSVEKIARNKHLGGDLILPLCSSVSLTLFDFASS